MKERFFLFGVPLFFIFLVNCFSVPIDVEGLSCLASIDCGAGFHCDNDNRCAKGRAPKKEFISEKVSKEIFLEKYEQFEKLPEDGGVADFFDEKVKKEPFSEPKLEKVPEEKVSKERPAEPPPKDGGVQDSGPDNQSEPIPENQSEPQGDNGPDTQFEPTPEAKPEPQPESVKETKPDVPNKRQCTAQSDCNGLFCDSCYCVPKGTFSDSCKKDTDCTLGGKCVGGICSLCHFSP